MDKKVVIKIGNFKSRIFGYVPDEAMDELYEKLAFKKKNIEYSPKVMQGKWDGYTRLFNRTQKTFQTGLISIVQNIIKKYGYNVEIDDQRIKPNKNRKWNLVLGDNIKSLYDFQQEAVYLSKKFSRGAFAIPTAGGKTLTFAAMISEINTAPVIVYVPNLLLLYQTKEAIEKFLRDENGNQIEVGIVGDGQCDIKDITIMTIQTAITAFDMEYDRNKDSITYLTPEQIQKKSESLKKKRKKSSEEDPTLNEDLGFVVERKEVLKDLIKNVKMIICDEGHRVSSAIYQEVLKQSSLAYYRFVLSGTLRREDNTELLIQSIFGRKLLSLTCSDLIRRKDVKVVRPYIFMVDVPDFEESKDFSTYAQIRKHYVVESEKRNYLIRDIALNACQYGPTLLLVSIIDHGKILEKIIPDSLFICSKTSKKQKQQALNDLMSGERKILIASPIIDEGLNLPDLKVLMLCDSGKAANQLYQRVGRVVRESENKSYGIVFDFKDKENMLSKHAKRREELYLMEDEWVVTHISSNGFKSYKGS